ncbi:MAG: amidohydrolase [Acidobacteriota bacterium]|jgi:hypothetical protein
MKRVMSLALGVAAAIMVACSPVPRADRLLVGGIVHTPRGAERASVAVAEGQILALVEASRDGAWRRAAREVLDLAGAHVYAGFTESHGHLVGLGAALEQVDLRGTTSFEEVIARVQQAAAELPAGSWVLGRGWDQNLWPEKEFPHHDRLSAAVPRHPVLLRRVDGHAALTNRLGLELAGVSAATSDPAGGRILRDAGGEPTGVLVDAAMALVAGHIPQPQAADLERRILRAAQALAGLGFTSFHDAGTSGLTLAVLRRLQEEGRLPIRVYCMLDGSSEELLTAALPRGPWVSGDGRLAVRAVKLYADGALGSRGAWLSAPYSDEPASSGLAVTPPAKLSGLVARIGGAGFQPCVHAIGDAAVTAVLDAFEESLVGAGLKGLRPRVEHAQIVRPEDVPRFAALGAIASVQPTHCTSDMPWVPLRLGQERTAWAYRWRSLLDARAALCLGSDVPVEDADPRLGMWAAVTRRTVEGTPPEGWNLAEALTAEEAILGYTQWAAYAAFEESWRGRILPGFAADFTIFDRDLLAAVPESLREARVLRTVVAGRDAFAAGGGS